MWTSNSHNTHAHIPSRDENASGSAISRIRNTLLALMFIVAPTAVNAQTKASDQKSPTPVVVVPNPDTIKTETMTTNPLPPRPKRNFGNTGADIVQQAQEELKKAEEELKKAQEELKKAQEKGEKSQEELKKAQEKLKQSEEDLEFAKKIIGNKEPK